MPDARAAMAQTLAADYGLPIIFLRDGDKRPKYKGEFDVQATLDPARIQAELGNGSNANYGIAWGPKAGAFALDVDEGGAATIASLEWEHGPLPVTWRIITQSGNYQDLWDWPDDDGPPIRNRGHFAAALDVRGQGGQSVGPGSQYVDRDTGEVREWRWAPGRAPWDIPRAKMPDQWLSLIRAHSLRPPKTLYRPTAPQATTRLEAFAASVMQAKLDALAAAPDGAQETALGAAALKAGSLIARGWISRDYCHDAIVDTLLRCQNYKPSEPWTYVMAVYKVTRGIERGESSPEPDPEWLVEIEERERPREHLRGINGGKANGSAQGAGEEPWPEEESPHRRLLFPPAVFRSLAELPTRQFLYGKHYIRRYLSATIGAPGTGKSMLALQEAMAMASGKPILGQACERRRVAYWNGEDPLEETERRAWAVRKHFGLTEADLDGWLFWGSGRDAEIVLARVAGRGSPEVDYGMVDDVLYSIRSQGLDVLIIDPFVSSHRVPESDNTAIDLVTKTWAQIAERANIAAEIDHHPRKTNGEQITVEDSRGASALAAGARHVRVLNQMTEDEAVKGRLMPDQRRSYFRADHGKANLAPPERATWFRFISIDLENGPEGLGDNVGVIVPWQMPDPLEDVSPPDVLRIQQKVAAGQWRENSQSPDWVGHAVAEVLGLDVEPLKTKPAQVRVRIKGMLDRWYGSGLLIRGGGTDDHGMPRKWVTVGKWMPVNVT